MRLPVHHTDIDIKIPLGPMLINVVYINYEPPVPSWGYPNHAHSSYELHYVTQGHGTLEVSQRRFAIEPGTFYLTGPGVYHKQIADADEPMDEYCINFEMKVHKRKRQKSDTFLSSEIEAILATLQNTNFWFGRDEFDTAALFRGMMQEFEREWLGHYTVIQSLATQVIVNAVRSFAEHRESTYHLPKKILNDSRRFLVDDYFQRPGDELRAEALADRIGISVRQLERLMHQYYGMTFQRKLLLSRMEKAKDLLFHTDLAINAVAEQVGYANTSYFGKHFRTAVGLTPAVYRTISRTRST